MSRGSRVGVLAAYRDGVTVICELAGQFTDVTWLAATPCSEWRAVDLAGHLRADLSDDGLHPNSLGFRLMAPIALAAIDKATPPRAKPKRRR